MAAVNPAAGLRTRARDALFAAGGRGFVRFSGEGELLISDAARRCESEQTAVGLLRALEKSGFTARISNGMIHAEPTDALIASLTAGTPIPQTDWQSPLHRAQALAARWMFMPPLPMTDCGRLLVRQTLRLIWQPQDRVLAGLGALRAQAAAMLRGKDASGMHEAGALLAQYCISQRGECV